MTSKEEIINSMCLAYRNDYGLRKLPSDPPWTLGMTDEDAGMLYKTMEQLYNENLKTLTGEKNAFKPNQ
jgi:hypothetical protein